jgi:hypothetical protein
MLAPNSLITSAERLIASVNHEEGPPANAGVLGSPSVVESGGCMAGWGWVCDPRASPGMAVCGGKGTGALNGRRGKGSSLIRVRGWGAGGVLGWAFPKVFLFDPLSLCP